MFHHSPHKYTKSEPVHKVKDLNIKLLNLFDAFDEQQILIKTIHKGSQDLSSNPTSLKNASTKYKSSKQFSSPNLTKLRPFSSREVFEKIPDLKNHEIINMTTKFHAYRHHHKEIKTEPIPFDEKPRTTEPKSVRILSGKKQINSPITVTIQTHEPSYTPFYAKDTARSNERSMPMTVSGTLTNFNFTTPEKTNTRKASETIRKPNSPVKEDRSAEKLAYLPEREIVSAYQTNRMNQNFTEVQGPWKFNGMKKIDLSEHTRVNSIAAVSNLRTDRSTSRKRGNSSTELKRQESPSALRATTAMSTQRSTFRIKKIEGEGVLKPPKVTVVQKKRLNDFLRNEFVDEVITNKHNARNLYDGEAFNNLNELKKILTSHVDVRQAMYGKEAKVEANENNQKPNAKNPMIKKEDKFPEDVPRLKRFELSDPDDLVLGVRPKNLISVIGDGAGQTSRRKNKAESAITITTTASEEAQRASDIEVKARNNFQPLKDAIEIQKARGKSIRQSLRDLLLKYARLNIRLQDLKHIDEIFPSKPYEKKGAFAFMRVVKSGDFYGVQEFLQQNKYFVFEYDPIKQTALHWCAKRGHARICSLLLEYGADTDAIDMGGKTPLYYALKEKNPEIVGRLLFSKANPWSIHGIDYKAICDDGWSLKYLNKARQLSILLMFHLAKDRQALWEKEAKALIAPIDTPLDDNDERKK